MAYKLPSQGSTEGPADYFRQSRSALAEQPEAILRPQQETAKAQVVEDMSWGDAIINRGEALGMGLVHGATSYGPEQFYRMFRTLGKAVGSDDLVEWSSDSIQDLLDERKNDSFYEVDPNWVKDEWGRSLYEGASSLAASIETGLPLLAATIATGGAAGLGSAFMAHAIGGGAVAGFAEYDSFIDGAYDELKELNPNLTKDELEDDKFWYAVMSGVAESGMEIAGDLIGGKLIGMFGKVGAEPARRTIQKLLFNATKTMGAELGTEGATAYLQNLARQMTADTETGALSHTTAGKAITSVIGPTLVSAGLSGAGRTMLKGVVGDTNQDTKEVTPESLRADAESVMAMVQGQTAQTKLGIEGYGLYNKLVEDGGYTQKNAMTIARIMEHEAENHPEGPEAYWASKQGELESNLSQSMSSRMALLNTFANPEATVESTVAESLEFLGEGLKPEEVQAIAAIPEYQDVERLREDLTKWIRAGRKDPKGLSAEFSEEAKSAFRAMRDKMLDTYGTVRETKSVKMSPEAVAVLDKALGSEFKTKSAQSPELFTLDRTAIDPETLSRAIDKNDDDAIDKLSSSVRINLDAWNADDPVKAFVGEIDRTLGKEFERELYKGNTDAEIEGKAVAELESEGWNIDAFKKYTGDVKGLDLAKNVRKSVLFTKVLARQAEGLAQQYKATGTIEDMARFRIAALAYQEVHGAYRGLAKELGTGLRAFQQASSDRDRGMDKMMRIIEATGGTDANEMLINALLNADPEQRGELLRNSADKKTRQHIVEAIMMGMLSSPKTHIANVFGQSYGIVEEIWNRHLASYAGMDTGVRKGEAGAMIRGMMQSIGTAWKAGIHVMRGGESAIDPRSKLSQEGLTQQHDDMSGNTAGMAEYFWNVMKLGNYPGKFLGGADEFFKIIAYNMQLEALKHRAASNDTTQSYEASFQALTENTPSAMKNEARDYMRYIAFQDELGKAGKAVNSLRQEYPLLSVGVVPFLSTPINLWKWGASRTPLLNKLVAKTQEDLKSQDPATRQLAEARLTTGTVLWTSALSMAAAGFITGPGPSDPEEKKKLRETGWQPNSFKIGDTYYAMDRVDPLSFTLTTAAAMVDAKNDLEDEDAKSIHSAMLGAIVNATMNRTYVAGIADALAAISDPERNLDWFVSQRASMFVPASALTRQVRTIQDPMFREVDGITGQIFNTIPGFSDDLPTKVNFLGEKVENEGRTVLSPFRTSSDKDDAVADEIYRLHSEGAYRGRRASRYMTHKGERRKLSAKDWVRYQQLAGQEVILEGKSQREALQSLFADQRYQNANDEQRGQYVERVVNRYRNTAKKAFVSEIPQLFMPRNLVK